MGYSSSDGLVGHSTLAETSGDMTSTLDGIDAWIRVSQSFLWS